MPEDVRVEGNQPGVPAGTLGADTTPPMPTVEMVPKRDLDNLRSIKDREVSTLRQQQQAAAQRLATLEQQLVELSLKDLPIDEAAEVKARQAEQKAAVLEQALILTRRQAEVRERVNELLSKHQIDRDDPNLDWAQEVNDPETGYYRLLNSVTDIVAGRTKQAEKKAIEQAQSATAKAQQQAREDKVASGQLTVETGGPTAPASDLNTWWQGMTRKQREDYIKNARFGNLTKLPINP